jgi:hypothetical protein
VKQARKETPAPRSAKISFMLLLLYPISHR